MTLNTISLKRQIWNSCTCWIKKREQNEIYDIKQFSQKLSSFTNLMEACQFFVEQNLQFYSNYDLNLIVKPIQTNCLQIFEYENAWILYLNNAMSKFYQLQFSYCHNSIQLPTQFFVRAYLSIKTTYTFFFSF